MRLRECCGILAFGVLACAVISWPVCRVAHDVMGVRVRSMHVRGASGPSAALRRRAWCRSRVGRARVGAARDIRRRRARRYLYNNLISSIASGAWTGLSSLTTLCVPRRSATAACCCVMRLEHIFALYLYSILLLCLCLRCRRCAGGAISAAVRSGAPAWCLVPSPCVCTLRPAARVCTTYIVLHHVALTRRRGRACRGRRRAPSLILIGGSDLI
jgi:hypothetical protein